MSNECPAVAYQSASVCVPVQVTPYANTGSTVTTCCGTPTVVSGQQPCGGVQNGSCFFTLSQDICVAIPIDFGAVATVVNTYVTCDTVSSSDICTNCT